MLRFYRGIAVPEDEWGSLAHDIRVNGLRATDQTTWQVEVVDLRAHLEHLFAKPGLSLSDTRPSELVTTDRGSHRRLLGAVPALCACGDELGGTYYATRHNRTSGKTAPLLVCFEADVGDVQIDGKDFMHNPMFQTGCTQGQRDWMIRIFGQVVERYVERAWLPDKKLDYRLALCDLAAQDPQVICDHHRNEIVLGGRCGTIFRSAFNVRLPVAPARIVEVTRPVGVIPKPNFTIEDFKRA